MFWLGAVLVISILSGLARGGKFLNLSEIKMRAWPLLLVGFLMQGIANALPSDKSWSHDSAVAIIILSYLPLLVVVGLNRTHPGVLLAGLGMFMNFVVIAANGGMPVLSAAAEIAAGRSLDQLDLLRAAKHVILDMQTRVSFLADVIPLRPFRSVISLGDVLLAVGLGQFVDHELRKPTTWLRHGLNQAKPGSASSG